MHSVAVRKSLLDKEPGLAQSLFKAYSESKTMNYNYMSKLGWAYDTLPWYGQEHEDTKRAMGANFWPYGMDANRKTLEPICRYCFEQGFIKKQINYEDMFFPGSMAFSE
jgi:4,5-dihydroxyphthalate decarboxylase